MNEQWELPCDPTTTVNLGGDWLAGTWLIGVGLFWAVGTAVACLVFAR